MQHHRRDELLGLLDSPLVGGVDKSIDVLLRGDLKLIQVVLKVFSELFHSSHIGEQDRLHDPLSNEHDLLRRKLP